MLFTSVNFLFFLAFVVLGYYLLHGSYRIWFLLVASYFFYGSLEPLYVFLLGGLTVVSYGFGLLISRKSAGAKGVFLFSGIALVLLPLLFYKYWPVIVELLGSIFSLSWSYKGSYILPVGISFYTFVSIGYLVDVYQEEVEAERNFGVLALFLSFFPLTLSGPIERANRMLPQVRESRTIDYLDLTSGFKLMLWGYFMKLVLADRLGQYIDVVYGNVQAHNGTTLLFTALLYPIQVYGDLGGYSLIAIGTSRMLGFRVRENFRRPFFATTMSEFWNRWHISLIKWLTDYVYTPLSFLFRKFGLGGIVLALMLTFIISGLWHGAAATFLVWGIMQGLFLSVEAISKRSRSRMERRFNLTTRWWYIVLGCVSTYVLFAASQIFARSKNIDEAMLIFSKTLDKHGQVYLDYTTLLVSLIAAAIVLGRDLLFEYGQLYVDRLGRLMYLRYTYYFVIAFMILLLGAFEGKKFMYFQF